MTFCAKWRYQSPRHQHRGSRQQPSGMPLPEWSRCAVDRLIDVQEAASQTHLSQISYPMQPSSLVNRSIRCPSDMHPCSSIVPPTLKLKGQPASLLQGNCRVPKVWRLGHIPPRSRFCVDCGDTIASQIYFHSRKSPYEYVCREAEVQEPNQKAIRQWLERRCGQVDLRDRDPGLVRRRCRKGERGSCPPCRHR